MYKLVVIACIAVILALAGLTISQHGAQAVDFTLNNGAECRSLDPHQISWKHEFRVAYALFEGLMAPKVDPPLGGEPRGRTGAGPNAGDRRHRAGGGPEFRPEPRRPDVHLPHPSRRPLVQRPAGDGATVRLELEADDDAADRGRLRRHDVCHRRAREYFGGLVKYEQAKKDQQAGKPAPASAPGPPSFDSVGLTAPDARTLVVRLKAPTAYFLELTSFPPFCPVYPPLLESMPAEVGRGQDENGITIYDESWTNPGTMVCDGPFVLASRAFKSEMVLAANPYYWDRAHVRLRRIRVLAIDDDSASLNAYESAPAT